MDVRVGGQAAARAICAVPFHAADSVVAPELGEALRSIVLRGKFREVASSDGAGDGRDDLTRALFGEAEQQAGVALRREVHRLGARGGTEGETSAHLLDPGDGSIHPLATVTITATPWEPNWFIDMRQISAVWASLLRFQNGTIGVDVVTYEGGPAACTTASDAWFVLDELERDLQELIAALQSSVPPGQEFDEQTLCPDSLMTVGMTCLDFYIAQATALGFMMGDNRGSNPYADLNQSKAFVLEDFNNNRVTLLITGSTCLYPRVLVGGYPLVLPGFVRFGADSSGQVNVFRVDSLDANTRRVTFSITNGVCPHSRTFLYSYFPPGTVPSWANDMACPPIDAEIIYVRDGSRWKVDQVSRDGFPNLDIHRKMPDGTIQRIHHSPNRRGGALWLWGGTRSALQGPGGEAATAGGNECELLLPRVVGSD